MLFRKTFTPPLRVVRQPFYHKLTPLGMVLVLGVVVGMGFLAWHISDELAESFRLSMSSRVAHANTSVAVSTTGSRVQTQATVRPTPQAVVILTSRAPQKPSASAGATTESASAAEATEFDVEVGAVRHEFVSEAMLNQAQQNWAVPQATINQLTNDLTEYYISSRARTLADYLQARDNLPDVYFTGPALKQMKQYEATRTRYGVNRGGTFDIRILSFSDDGQQAKVIVTFRNWLNDAYDVRTRQLVQKDVSPADSEATMLVRFDAHAQRWKIHEFVSILPLQN
jgi:hypothetical protein